MALTKNQTRYLQRYVTAEKIMKDFLPEFQVNFARYPTKCLLGDCPTIADMKQIWGGRFAEIWLANQVRDLAEYAGTDKKLDTLQLEEVARMAAQEFYYFKLSEFMLFFAHFKAGRYGKFYGNVDPLVIAEALQKFKQWRNGTLDYLHECQQREEINKRPTNDPEKLTYTEWKELKWLFNMGYERGADGRIQ